MACPFSSIHDGERQYKYGAILTQGSDNNNDIKSGSVHLKGGHKYPTNDRPDYDDDEDDGYIRFVRPSDTNGKFLMDPLSQDRLRGIVNIVVNVSEWYAFALFGYFSDVIGDVFFPPSGVNNSTLIESLATFGSAFVTRPIGGVCLGYIGDVYGRKLALEVSVFLMAIATLGMACLPTYSHVGTLSYVLLTVCRLVQGLSAGGQLMGSLVYAVENKPRKDWGYHGSMVMAAANCGNVMSGVTVFFLRLWMSEENLPRIGWRIPNIVVGIILTLCGLLLKYVLEEDSIPLSELQNGTQADWNPLRLAWAPDNRRSLLAACMVPVLYSTGFWLTFVWMTMYMLKLIPSPMSAPEAFGVSSSSLFVSVCIFFPIAGMLSDTFGRRNVMTVGGVGYGVMSPILLVIIGRGKVVESLVSQTLLGVFLSLWGGPMMAWLVEAFDPHTRLTSAAVGYNLGVMVAGVAPATATYMANQLGPSTPGLLLSLLAVIGLSGLWLVAPRPPMTQTAKEGNCIATTFD